jgi:hypothetical protein
MDKILKNFDNKCLRRITNRNWRDLKSNDKLREEIHQIYVLDLIRKRRWSYIGHALQTDETIISHIDTNR